MASTQPTLGQIANLAGRVDVTELDDPVGVGGSGRGVHMQHAGPDQFDPPGTGGVCQVTS